MTKIQKIEEMIYKMTRSERAYVFQPIVSDLGDAFPYGAWIPLIIQL